MMSVFFEVIANWMVREIYTDRAFSWENYVSEFIGIARFPHRDSWVDDTIKSLRIYGFTI